MIDSVDSRSLLLAVGVVVVALAGVVGFVVGSNGAATRASIRPLGLVTLPTTPATMSLYAMALATVVLAALFGAAALAGRYDDAAVR